MAERIVREVRTSIARNREPDWNMIADLIIRWIPLAGKEAFEERETM